ncbi:MAG: S8 family serine peptidase [Planctomycetota bacterium]
MMSLIVASGCGPIPDVTTQPDDGSNSTGGSDNTAGGQSQVGFRFEEDSDPVLANQAFNETELLVQAYPGADPTELAAAYSDAGATVVEALSEIQLDVLRVPEGHLYEAAGRLQQSGMIETLAKSYVYEPGKTANDASFASQDHISSVNLPSAWDRTTGSVDVMIGVVDTGVDGQHVDLVDRLVAGWNVYDGNSEFTDVLGHGTAVAGVLGAMSDNGIGVAGVTWSCPIIPVRAADSAGKSSSRYVASGILWALGHGAKAINVSFAPLWSDRVIRSAAEQAFHRGSLVVMSAGNSSSVATAGGYVEGVFVGALNDQSGIASFSDRGPFVDLVAPGTTVLSTSRGGGYSAVDGTSFAAPIVTGVAALVWSVNPNLRPSTVVDILTRTSRDLGDSGLDSTFGNGLVDASRAVEEAARVNEPPDTTPPTLQVSSPMNNATLSGSTVSSVTSTDTGGVADVVLSIDGVPYATDPRSPYQFLIDPKRYSSTAHQLSYVATDFSGNRSIERQITVTFGSNLGVASSTASQIVFSSPANGSQVTIDVTIRATVLDSDGLSVVEWFVDGVSAFAAPISGTSSGVSFTWRIQGVSRGAHTIALAVTDSLGNRTTGQLSLRR